MHISMAPTSWKLPVGNGHFSGDRALFKCVVDLSLKPQHTHQRGETLKTIPTLTPLRQNGILKYTTLFLGLSLSLIKNKPRKTFQHEDHEE